MAPTGIVRRVGRRLKRDVLGATPPGAVDGCDGVSLSGWAGPGHATVKVVHGDRVLLETVADGPRPDVAAAGAGPLESGFTVSMEAVIAAVGRADDRGAAATLRVVGPGGALPGSSPVALGADDLVSAVALRLARGRGA